MASAPRHCQPPRQFSFAASATQIQLGRIAYEQGDYPSGHRHPERVCASLGGTPLDASFGLAAPVAVMSRVWLIWSLAELGAFDEGRRHSEEATRIATALNHPFSRVVALLSAGLLALRQGEIPQAIPPLEQSLTLCQATHYSEPSACGCRRLGLRLCACGASGRGPPAAGAG